MNENIYHEGVGRRKESTARARVFVGGGGDFVVNDKKVDNYFTRIGDAENKIHSLIKKGESEFIVCDEEEIQYLYPAYSKDDDNSTV